jgi:hypothetical protein
MRTNPASLVAIYGLFSICWITTFTAKKITKTKRYVLLGILCLIPLHHVAALWTNYKFIGQPSSVSYQLGTTGTAPDKQLAPYVAQVQKQPLTLACTNKYGQYVHCRYQELYAAVAGSCVWNQLKCYPIFGYDMKTKEYIELDPYLWLSYYWAH